MAKTGITFNANYKKLEIAIQKLPQFVEVSTRMFTKRVAIQFTKYLKDNIQGRKLRLRRLKVRAGGVPLFESGEFVNKLGYRFYKRASGGIYYVGAVSGKMHSKSGLRMSQLLRIHEYGTTIKVTPRQRAFLHTIGIHVKNETKYIKIPPRPALRLSWMKYLRSMTFQKKRNQELEKQMRNYFRTARIQWAEIRDSRAKEYI